MRENLEKQFRVVLLKGSICKALTCFALKKTRENLEKQLRVVLLKGNICKALACFALLCSSLEFTIINIYQIKVFVYHS